MAKFISDEEMAKLESAQPKKFISDAEMADLESKSQPSASVTDLIRPIQQGASLGFADEIGALGAKAGQALGSGIRSLVTGDSAPIQSYDQLLQEQRSADKAVNETYPIASTVAEIAGGGVLPVSSIGGMAAQGAAYGLGKSEADNLGGMAKDAALGGAIAGGTGAALKALPAVGSAIVDNSISNKVKDWIANSRLGKTFAGGKNVQKYTDPAAQTDLANSITNAIDKKQAEAALQHSNVRQVFTETLGDTPVDTKSIASTISDRINKFGPDLNIGGKALGPMTSKEAQDLATYLDILNPKAVGQKSSLLPENIELKATMEDIFGDVNNNPITYMENGRPNSLKILATDKVSGDEIGRFSFQAGDIPGEIYAGSARVEPNFQRKGVGTAAYDLAEQLTNAKVIPSPIAQTDKAKAFWEKRLKTSTVPQTETSKPLTAQQLYKVWDDVKKSVDYGQQVGASSAYNQQLQGIQAGIKDKLHALSPELTAADANISQLMGDAGLLRSARKDSTAESFLAGLNGRNKGNTREALDRTIGDNADLMKRIEDFQTYQSWNKQGGFGSDSGLKNVGNVALGSMLGGTVGAAAASVLGQSATQRALVSAAGEAFHKATGIAAPIYDKLAPKFQTILREAANRGGNAAAVTYFLLQSSDPEFQAQIKEESSK